MRAAAAPEGSWHLGTGIALGCLELVVVMGNVHYRQLGLRVAAAKVPAA
jgi:hypothetical protein